MTLTRQEMTKELRAECDNSLMKNAQPQEQAALYPHLLKTFFLVCFLCIPDSSPIFIPLSSVPLTFPVHFRGIRIMAERSVMPPASDTVCHRVWGARSAIDRVCISL